MKNSTIANTYWDEFRHYNKCIKISMDACLCLVVSMNDINVHGYVAISLKKILQKKVPVL